MAHLYSRKRCTYLLLISSRLYTQYPGYVVACDGRALMEVFQTFETLQGKKSSSSSAKEVKRLSHHSHHHHHRRGQFSIRNIIGGPSSAPRNSFAKIIFPVESTNIVKKHLCSPPGVLPFSCPPIPSGPRRANMRSTSLFQRCSTRSTPAAA